MGFLFSCNPHIPSTASPVSTSHPGHSGILGMEGSQDDGHKVGPGMGGSFGQGHRAVRSRPLILSPMLFQYHTASEPTLRTPLCSRFLSVPQSHSCGHSRTWGQTILSQPGAFEPSLPRPALFLLFPEPIHPGSWGSLHYELFSSGVLHCGGGCGMLRGTCMHGFGVQRAISHCVSHWGLGTCGS